MKFYENTVVLVGILTRSTLFSSKMPLIIVRSPAYVICSACVEIAKYGIYRKIPPMEVEIQPKRNVFHQVKCP
jgi:hypothetical protein